MLQQLSHLNFGLWLRIDLSILVQGRTGQRDPRKACLWERIYSRLTTGIEEHGCF
jgi:hypothetical protein